MNLIYVIKLLFVICFFVCACRSISSSTGCSNSGALRQCMPPSSCPQPEQEQLTGLDSTPAHVHYHSSVLLPLHTPLIRARMQSSWWHHLLLYRRIHHVYALHTLLGLQVAAEDCLQNRSNNCDCLSEHTHLLLLSSGLSEAFLCSSHSSRVETPQSRWASSDDAFGLNSYTLLHL